MLLDLLHRRLRPLQPARAGGRTDICPPSLLRGSALAASGWRAGLRDWLSTGWGASASGPQGQPWGRSGHDLRAEQHLRTVRNEFLAALQGIGTPEVASLRHSIGIARSLRELWHLRPEVFRLVALRFSQAEAQSRLDQLNRHFPTRSPRSGFAPL